MLPLSPGNTCPNLWQNLPPTKANGKRKSLANKAIASEGSVLLLILILEIRVSWAPAMVTLPAENLWLCRGPFQKGFWIWEGHPMGWGSELNEKEAWKSQLSPSIHLSLCPDCRGNVTGHPEFSLPWLPLHPQTLKLSQHFLPWVLLARSTVLSHLDTMLTKPGWRQRRHWLSHHYGGTTLMLWRQVLARLVPLEACVLVLHLAAFRICPHPLWLPVP